MSIIYNYYSNALRVIVDPVNFSVVYLFLIPITIYLLGPPLLGAYACLRLDGPKSSYGRVLKIGTALSIGIQACWLDAWLDPRNDWLWMFVDPHYIVYGQLGIRGSAPTYYPYVEFIISAMLIALITPASWLGKTAPAQHPKGERNAA